MFARTARLFLRPGWIEDAPALQKAIAHACVTKNLARAPWPYSVADALSFLEMQSNSDALDCLIFERTSADPQLIGGIGIVQDDDGAEFGYWLTPEAWGKGFVTEAGRAIIQNARESLKFLNLKSAHFVDNPASGRVLQRLGFAPTGAVEDRYSLARGTMVPTVMFEQELN